VVKIGYRNGVGMGSPLWRPGMNADFTMSPTSVAYPLVLTPGSYTSMMAEP
jgi:hypothetical protein